jgi:hypothetical protein
MSRLRTARKLASAQDGFTMIIALGVMFVTALLMVAAFKAASGDIRLSHDDAAQKQAYSAALAGVQEYEYHLQSNPDYWETCGEPTNTVPQESGIETEERYQVKLLPASTAPVGTKACSTSNPFGTMIQAGGPLANTFRIESVGTAGKSGSPGYETRKIVAAFHVVGFLNYAYFTQYETEDPLLYGGPTWCANYRAVRKADEIKFRKECQSIVFYEEDSVKGPVHTDDEAEVCGSVSFGREGHNPPDVVDFNGGYTAGSECTAKPTFNTATKNYTVGQELLPPEGDTSLGTYVKEGGEGGEEFVGVTHIVLNGTNNTVEATTIKSGKTVKETLAWPKNGLIYVRASTEEGASCEYDYSPGNSDNSEETSQETSCGNVYVSGTYSKPITIGAENDLIINGEVYPTSVAGKLGNEPSGTATLGLIAGGYVRIYHPCSRSNGAESLSSPWIYAAILSTNHSFIVDNFGCGASLGKLHIYGAIAQRFRGPVGTYNGRGETTGYLKDYKYDERLAVDEPPYFLNPINAGWEIARETAPEPG